MIERGERMAHYLYGLSIGGFISFAAGMSSEIAMLLVAHALLAGTILFAVRFSRK
ncbi:MAG: hypothetical protein UX33_C0022G0010 [Candidatus Azambacteria bacterium GW2011_GWC1_46_13]|uniref:Uncharacterized protein n=1 Tax=Candidatus Azambacteria bacterium GW2011_GWC1_46_13 TaxID=1618619 RepID=A0A0G1QVD4_9BACT|nr:MAG: hypothetical protein UX33_C0022G0010 [Candidatus Azambacteria bacterium GW2011_GWC1_46_13]